MKKFAAVLLVLIICAGVCSCGQKSDPQAQSTTQATTSPAKKVADVSEIKKRLKLENFRGSALVTKDSKPLMKLNSGKTAVKKGSPITENTAFCVASVTKQFTAVAVLQLKEKGLLSLDDTIDLYFPDYKLGKKNTIHNLLSMRSGIPDYIYEDNKTKKKFGVRSKHDYKQNRKGIEKWILSQKLVFEPGKDYQYSNSNYFLLAAIVEQVSGMGWGKYVRTHFFNPLGMTRSGFLETYKISKKTFALPIKGKSAEFMNIKGAMFGTANIVSTASDLEKWLDAVEFGKLISDESVQQMTTSYTHDPDRSYGYGYGLMLSDNDVFYTTGAITSYNAFAAIDRTTHHHVILLTNYSSDVAFLGRDILPKIG